MKKDAKVIVVGGLAATGVFTMLMLIAPIMGFPEMPIWKMLAGFMGVPVVLGWAAHFMIGLTLAAIFVKVLRKKIAGNNVVKGIVFGFIPFLAAQLIVMPMMGAGIFSTNTGAPLLMVIGSLMGHIVFGAVLGLVVGKFEEAKYKKYETVVS